MSTIPEWHHATTDTPRGRSYWTVREGVTTPDDLVAVVNRAHDDVPLLPVPKCERPKRRPGEQGAGGEVAVRGTVPLGAGRAPHRGTPRVLKFCMACIVRPDA